MKAREQEKLDRQYMARALKLASHGLYTASPNPAVGCVIVRDGKIIGEGWHHRAGEGHAEIMALESVNGSVKGATVYVTLEPCSHYGRTPPCAVRLVHEGIKRCVIAVGDPNPKVSGRGVRILKSAGIEVKTGVLEKKAWFLNRAFMKAITSDKPFVTVKTGMSLDAKIALKDGQSQWITSARSRSQTMDLRARSDAIITGSGTVIADNPRLSVRYAELPGKAKKKVSESEIRQPLKVVLDSRSRLNPDDFELFKAGGRVLWCTAQKKEQSVREERIDDRVTRLYVPSEGGHISLSGVLEYLGAHQIRRVLVEAGGTLTGSFISADLADEVYAFVAPVLLGTQSQSAFVLSAPQTLSESARLCLHSVKKIGDDVRLHYLNVKTAAALAVHGGH
ncbi:MAG: bifunctional diaminohydroxyphosphoribosylaminopyrimidine deaminase/5-amino-6-(5-phosphoribosylamino)uracil reductase RibD [Succinatimonas hippei]|nr:bifunctional diaminohydroxyphosphoribosylaminopyrimidine deaminase/5-amino-6-(5-phosphoribosylamino)uracil reductase RibD [Succinatimonas hippei]